jgi:hypothetical protein
MSQPSRAGLKFGYRPYGPRSDSRSIFGFPHRLISALGRLKPCPSYSEFFRSLFKPDEDENVRQHRVLSQRQECSTIG